ncbi:MAG: UDP binding domain-containing protein, partial [Acidimicrobiales bacterium]|nr:UDP binding domain-containing protein [Acidimicrobiales bacterium]
DVLGFTARPFEGDLVSVRTKMGRSVRVTPDHPFVVGDGARGATGIALADELLPTHWLPVAQGSTLDIDLDPPTYVYLADAVVVAGIDPAAVIVRLDDAQMALLDRVPTLAGRRVAVKRSGTARLADLRAWGIPDGGTWSTVTNGTYVPYRIPLDHEFWHVLGLYLAEGHVAADGRRRRLMWSFHRTNEPELVEAVRGYWDWLGVKCDVRRATTAMNVTVSSVLLSALFKHVLGLGANCYTKAIPDLVWSAGEMAKWSLLRGLWDGDGSWSKVNGGPSVILEYGTVSPRLADGMLRLLGDLGVVASQRVGRTAKSTCDTYWLRIAGATQIEEARWLLPDDEHPPLLASIWRQQKRIAPTGYRRLDDKAVAWVRVTATEREQWSGTVYSLEVDQAHTVVTTNGLIAHNCFPKDTRALIHMAEDRGYGFDILRSVVEVNNEQYERVVEKIVSAAGGSVDGKTIAVWGLTFKARTDDMRESPSLFVIERLRKLGAVISAYDPMVTKQLDGIKVCGDAYAAVEGAATLAVLTEWDEFRYLEFDKVRTLMSSPTIVDARNLLDPVAVRRLGFIYDGIGRL